MLRSAVAINEQTGNHAEAARSLARLSHNLQGLGLYEAAVREAESSLQQALLTDDEGLACGALIAKANCWLDLGRYESAIALYTSTLEDCVRIDDIHRANICLINSSLCRIEQEDWSEAERALAPFDLRNRPVVPRFVGAIEYQKGLIAEGKRDWSRAHHHFQTSVDIRRQNGQSALLIDSMSGLLRVAIARHDLPAIQRLLADIDERVTQHGMDGIEHVARMCLAMMEGGELADIPALAAHYAEAGLTFLTRRAEAISQPTDRQTYLGQVPAHRALLQIAPAVLARSARRQISHVASD